jgi:hypothetical protein
MDEHQQRRHDLADRLVRIVDPSSPQAVAAAVTFLLTIYVGLALAYRDAIPLFEAPDEFSHFHYASFVYENHRLPRQHPLEVPGEGMQAPLVYVVAAPLLGNSGLDVAWVAAELGRAAFPFYSNPKVAGGSAAIAGITHGNREFTTDGSLESLRVLRSTSLAFGLLAVILTFAAAWRLSRDARFALLAGGLVAFDPQFLFSSGYFSNDPAAAAIGAAGLWIIARALEEPAGPARRHYVAGAILCAFGVWTKTSTLPGIAAAAATLIAIDRRANRAVGADVGFAAAIALLLAGPYVLWAAEHRGGLLGLNAVVASAVGMLRTEPFGGQLSYLAGYYWDYTFESFWGRFGWFNVRMSHAAYLVFFALTWTGVLGWVAGRPSRIPAEMLRSRALRGYLFAAAGATIALHLAMNCVIVNPQGRLLFASISQIAFLLALGVVRLIGSPRRLLPITITVVFALLLLDVYCLRGVLIPAYR